MNDAVGWIIALLMLLFLGFIIYRTVTNVIEFVKERKKLHGLEKTTLDFMSIVLLIPAVAYCMDRYNIFSFFKLTENISTNYDWLSFIGTYVSIVVSTYMLIYVTRMDRKESNENVRESQRPCLFTSIYAPLSTKNYKTEMQEKFITTLEENMNDFGKFVINITNSGQTVAIIDMERSYITFQKIVDEIEIGKNPCKIQTISKEEKVFFCEYEDRLHINSNNSAKLVITNDGMYRNVTELPTPTIKEVYIEYKDLFRKVYKDYIKLVEGKVKVIYDNEVL